MAAMFDIKETSPFATDQRTAITIGAKQVGSGNSAGATNGAASSDGSVPGLQNTSTPLSGNTLAIFAATAAAGLLALLLFTKERRK